MTNIPPTFLERLEYVPIGAYKSSFKQLDNLVIQGDVAPKEFSIWKQGPDQVREAFGKLTGVTKSQINQTYNTVKICTNERCKKPNAISLLYCNSCGTKLPDKISQTDNILYCFVFGKGFPVSIRHQTEKCLVYDDILVLSRIHLNAIPTDVHAPDMRVLFSNPKKGLELIKRLYASTKVALKKFLGNTTFRNKIYGKERVEYLGVDGNITNRNIERFIEEYVLCGFNCPPSQFHLHLQTIVLPLTPQQIINYAKGLHFTPERFFNYEYVVKCLEYLQTKATLEEKKLAADFGALTDPVEIIKFFQDVGISYGEIHSREYNKVEKVHLDLDPWVDKDFKGVYDLKKDVATVNGKEVELSKFFEDDKAVLGTYCKAKLSYYTHKRTRPLRSFKMEDESSKKKS